MILADFLCKITGITLWADEFGDITNMDLSLSRVLKKDLVENVALLLGRTVNIVVKDVTDPMRRE